MTTDDTTPTDDALYRAWAAGAATACVVAEVPLWLVQLVKNRNPHRPDAPWHQCDTCGIEKPPSRFAPRPWTDLGHSPTCDDCKAELRELSKAARDAATAEREAARKAENRAKAEAVEEAARLEEEAREAKCPTPTKKVHATNVEALAHIQGLYRSARGNPDYNAYKCACGVWHVGHSKFRLSQRIRQSLGSGRGKARRR